LLFVGFIVAEMLENWRHKVFIKNKLARGALGEFFGTFLLVFIGDCVVAQTVLSRTVNNKDLNSWLNINVGWGFAIVFCILIVGRSSGGHINPAVTVMLWSFGAVDAVTTAVYCVAQTVGAFFGAAAVFLYYFNAMSVHNEKMYTETSSVTWFDRLDGGQNQKLKYLHLTAGIYTSFPSGDYLSTAGAFVDQVVGTAVLCLFIAAILDKRNEIPAHLHALFFGFVVMMIGCGFGMNVGYPINPARDFGPRLFAALVYNFDVFLVPDPAYWIMPILGPFVGGVLGGWLYYLGSGFQIPEEVVHSNHGHIAHNIAHHNDEAVPLTKGEDPAPTLA